MAGAMLMIKINIVSRCWEFNFLFSISRKTCFVIKDIIHRDMCLKGLLYCLSHDSHLLIATF